MAQRRQNWGLCHRCLVLPLLLLPVFGAVLVAAAQTAPAVSSKPNGLKNGPPPPATPMQQRLQRYLPELYAKTMAEYGWREWHDGKWELLPEKLPPRVVVLVHGVDEPGKLWRSLAPALSGQGYIACELRYPNDQPIRASAAYLQQSLADLHNRGVQDIIIVAHSMGGLLSREMLTNPDFDYPDWRKQGLVPGIKRLVMLGTPNHGSELARGRFFSEIRDQWLRLCRGEEHLLSGLADGTGEAGKDLLPESAFLKDLNARALPQDVAFTIIAGLASPISPESIEKLTADIAAEPDSTKRQLLQKLKNGVALAANGIGDGCVPVASARLEGVTDFVTVTGTHLSMIRNVLAGSDRVPPAVPLILARIRQDWGAPSGP